MSRRRSRVPGTRATVYRHEVALGVDPLGALTRALRRLRIQAGEVWSIAVGHDDGCPALKAGMPACTCELVTVEARRAA